MRVSVFLAAGAACILAGCGAADDAEASADEPLSQLNINSAKRQCVSVAVIQQVPGDAAKEVCDCTVDRLIEAGQYTANTAPSDQQQQAALDACIDSAAVQE